MQENIARNWARAYPDDILKKRGLSKHEWQHGNTAGMQGFVMNQRRKPFDNVLVRQAMVESFDFENTNTKLFYGAYRRSNSFFTNSAMAATGKPSGAELALLNTVKTQLPQAVFTQNVPQPPVVNPQIGVRPQLLKARTLLLKAGYRYQNGKLVDALREASRPEVGKYYAQNPGRNVACLGADRLRDIAKSDAAAYAAAKAAK